MLAGTGEAISQIEETSVSHCRWDQVEAAVEQSKRI
jgi:hypothetical protein